MELRCLSMLAISGTLLCAQQAPGGRGGPAAPSVRDALRVSEPAPNVPFPFTTFHRDTANFNANAVLQDMRSRCPIARSADAAEPAAALGYSSLRLNAAIAGGRAKKLAQVQFSPCDIPSWFRTEEYAALLPYPTTDAQRASAPF